MKNRLTAQPAVKKTRLAAAGVLLMAASLGLWSSGACHDDRGAALTVKTAAPEPAPETSEPTAPAASLAQPSRPAEKPQTPYPATQAPAPFQDGFCLGDEAEEIEITRTLKGLASAELQRRRRDPLADGATPGTALLQQLFTVPVSDVRGQAGLLRTAESLSKSEPSPMWPLLVAAVSARAMQQPQNEVRALRKLNQLRPHDPAVGLALALATRSDADVDEAIAGLGDFLSVEPSEGLARLKARLEVQRDIQRGFERRSQNGVTLLWPADSMSAAQALRLLDAVDQALHDAALLTGTARRESLAVMVYPGRSELLAVSCAASWAGGLFDGALRLVANGTEPLGVDAATVQHESMHAQLSPAVPTAPKWFHEGVAQSFANESAQSRAAWAAMVRNRVWVPFESLDGSFAIFGTSDAHLAYAQSLAMVEFMRDRCGAAALPAALDAFQHAATTPQALRTACRTGVTGAELIGYLKQRLAN